MVMPMTERAPLGAEIAARNGMFFIACHADDLIAPGMNDDAANPCAKSAKAALLSHRRRRRNVFRHRGIRHEAFSRLPLPKVRQSSALRSGARRSLKIGRDRGPNGARRVNVRRLC